MIFFFQNLFAAHYSLHSLSSGYARAFSLKAFTNVSPVIITPSRACSSSGNVPFVKQSVDFELLKKTLQRKDPINSWPSTIQNFCETYFHGREYDLRETFEKTSFSPGFFGALCAAQEPETKSRFKKRTTSQTDYGSRSRSSTVGFAEFQSAKFGRKVSLPAANNFTDLIAMVDDLKEDAALHRNGTPRVPDFLFDMKCRIATELLFLSLTDDPEPASRIYQDLSDLQDAECGSYFEKDLEKFFATIDKALGKSKRDFVFAPRPSGFAVELCYDNGLIQSAYAVDTKTDITEFMRAMPCIAGIIPETKN